jgi:hypothetical protein
LIPSELSLLERFDDSFEKFHYELLTKSKMFLQIYVEVERARLTHILAQMKENEGEVTEAADILQELQVETYGSMEKREKV